jgi:DNA-binding LacI/PurR family transcriptional regulator
MAIRQGNGRNGVVTVKDVARAAGVSHTAVSMAVRGVPGVSEDRRRQILAIAARLDYRPRAAASLLRAKRTGQIGVILSGKAEDVIFSTFLLQVMVYFVKVCEAEACKYHIEFMEPELDTEFQPPHQLTGGWVDGTIVVGDVGRNLRHWLTDQDLYPWVSMDEPSPYCVLTAMDQGVYEATQHLAALGHRRIAYAGGPLRFSTHRLGLEGFQRAAADFALAGSGDRIWNHEFLASSTDDAMQAAAEWAETLLVDPHTRPTAVLCHDMRLARALLFCAARRGVRIPQELSIIATGTSADATKTYPCLSSIEPDWETTARQAVRLLRDLVAGKTVRTGTHWVAPRLVNRQTVARPGTDELLSTEAQSRVAPSEERSP